MAAALKRFPGIISHAVVFPPSALSSTAVCVMLNARPPLLLCLFLFFSVVNSLHFYLDDNEKRCFIEELPTDTVVEGKRHH